MKQMWKNNATVASISSRTVAFL